MVIDASGNVTPCSFYGGFGNNLPTIGNVNEQTILQVWNGRGYRRLRRFMLSEQGRDGCPGCLAMKQGSMETPVRPPDLQIDRFGASALHSDALQNYETMRREVAARRLVLDSRPQLISYTNSYRCNFRCTMCYQDHDRTLDLAARERVDAELLDLVPTLLQLTAGGGEPLLLPIWRNLIQTFDPAQNPLLTFATTTNGSLLDHEMLQRLERFPSLLLNFSLDASQPELFEAIRLRSKWLDVYSNLRRCIELRDRTADARRVYVSACMTVMRSNFHDLPGMLRLMSQLRLPIGFSPLNVFPIDESLSTIHDPAVDFPHRRAVLDAALRLFQEDPVLAASPFSSFRSHIEVLETLIPWHLGQRKHHTVTGAVPIPVPPAPAQHRARPTFERPLLAFFPVESGTLRPCRYWAPLAIPEERFTAHLAPGRYRVAVVPRNRPPSLRGPVWLLDVGEDGHWASRIGPTPWIDRARTLTEHILPTHYQHVLRRFLRSVLPWRRMGISEPLDTPSRNGNQR